RNAHAAVADGPLREPARPVLAGTACRLYAARHAGVGAGDRSRPRRAAGLATGPRVPAGHALALGAPAGPGLSNMICVIGAGIVGCASAFQLAREGHRVLLLDAAPGPGEGCSFANGGQLSYSYVEPLATPATLRALPKMLLGRDSPVTFRPTLDWRQYAWGLQFLAACRDAQVKGATRQLLELSFLS